MGKTMTYPRMLCVFLVGVLLVQSHSVRGGNLRATEKSILDKILSPEVYDPRIRPSAPDNSDDPVKVTVNTFIRSISSIDDVKMEYTAQLTFREQWLDPRLTYGDMGGTVRYLTLTDPEKIWKPDLFFSNEKEGHFHNIIMPNVLLRIYPNGGVLYSVRITLKLSCPMNLRYYPMDSQRCDIRMASYGYTTEDLVFAWKEGDPIQISKNIYLPRFNLEKFATDYCTSKTNTGEYSCLLIKLDLRRSFSYYLVQIYIPGIILVFISWVSFWLDQGAVMARIALVVTTLLTMAIQTSGINSSLPPVSYTKAIDVWTGVCLTFVFAALLEFAIVKHAHQNEGCEKATPHKGAPTEATGDENEIQMAPLVEINDGQKVDAETKQATPQQPSSYSPLQFLEKLLKKYKSRSRRIDVISRVLFPVSFAFFNLIYWCTYAAGGGELN